MSEQDRTKWNARYEKQSVTDAPSTVVRRFIDRAPKGRALDLAAGNGRNALFLAENGFRVDAVDISDVAMKRLEGRHPGIDAVCTDLDTYLIAPGTYELIVNIRFLDRRLFASIKDGLKTGGVLIFESYLLPPPGHPIADTPTDGLCRDYYLKKNELRHAFRCLEILFYQERRIEPIGKRSRIATLVAVKR